MTDQIQSSAERYKGSTIDMSLPEIGYVENKKQHFTNKQMLNTPAPFYSSPETFQSLAEKDLSNLKGRDQSGKPISVIQVITSHARSPELKKNGSQIFKEDGSPREEAVHGVTIVKRNTY